MSSITVEMIEEKSSKVRLQKFWDGYRERFGKDPEVHRHPDTCVGFLSKEKVHEMFIKADPDQLLMANGLTLIDDGKVAFFADDHGFGWGALPSNFGHCSITNLHLRYGTEKEFPTVDAIIDRYLKGMRFLNSMEELVDYINSLRNI